MSMTSMSRVAAAKVLESVGAFTRGGRHRLVPRRSNTSASVSGASSPPTAVAAAGTAAAAAAAAPPAPAPTLLRTYYTLSKFRLSLLVTSTAACGFLLSSGTDVDWPRFASTCGGVLATSGAASALNQVYEGDRDALMKRTRRRPIPSGRIGNVHATGFALALVAAGEVLLYCNTGVCSATLAGANVLLYAGVYTPLKVMSITNTWVGAVVGAVPPLIGWAAAKGEGMDLHASFATTKPGADEGRTPYRKLLAGIDEPAAYVLPALLYFWQLPHFMSLAWMCRSDYALGGYRMLPLLDPAGTKTAFVCMRNCMYLLPVGFIGVSSCLTSYPFAIVATILNVYMADGAMKFLANANTDTARLLFRRSLWHLPIVMGAAVAFRLPQDGGFRQQQRGAEPGDAEVAARSGTARGETTTTRERRAWGDTLERPELKPSSEEDPVRAVARTRLTSSAETETLKLDIQAAPFPFLPPPSWSKARDDG